MPIFEIGKKMFCIAFCFELCIFSIKWLLFVGEISRWIRQTDPSDDESDCQRFLECLDGKKGNGRRRFFTVMVPVGGAAESCRIGAGGR